MNLAELADLTDLELADKVLTLAEPGIAIPRYQAPYIDDDARSKLESFFRELRKAWQRAEHDRKSRELTGEFPRDPVDWEYNPK